MWVCRVDSLKMTGGNADPANSNAGDRRNDILELARAIREADNQKAQLPKVQVPLFDGTNASAWAEKFEQLGSCCEWSSEKMLQMVKRYCMVEYKEEVSELVQASRDWSDFKAKLLDKYQLGDQQLDLADLRKEDREKEGVSADKDQAIYKTLTDMRNMMVDMEEERLRLQVMMVQTKGGKRKGKAPVVEKEAEAEVEVEDKALGRPRKWGRPRDGQGGLNDVSAPPPGSPSAGRLMATTVLSRPAFKRPATAGLPQTRRARRPSRPRAAPEEGPSQPRETETILIEEDDGEEDELLRAEDERQAKQRVMEREPETGKADAGEGELKKKKQVYTIPVEQGLDTEQIVDWILESRRDLFTLKEFLAAQARTFFRGGRLGVGAKRKYNRVGEKARPVLVLITQEEEVYYKEEREWIRMRKEESVKAPCRLMEERIKNTIIGEEESLTEKEVDFLVIVMKKTHLAYAFDDDERRRLDVDMVPMIRIHMVPHEPWNIRGPRYPNPDDHRIVVEYLDGKIRTKVVDYSYGPYASPWFCFIKPSGVLRWVQNLQRLNSVTVRDAGGLPHADQLSESCAGRPIITLIDLYSGYDQFPLYTADRPMTAMHTPRGLIHMCAAPQGWTNAVAIVQRYMMRVMQPLCPDVTSPYIDDLAIPRPRVKDETEVLPGVRKFVWEHVRNVENVLSKLKEYNLTVSGVKSRHCMSKATILGFLCDEKGRRPDSKKTNKILE
ncbi:hypothetical protein CBR_g3879 [Chara braunii]|uniref:Reverse transcriptase domain-containing protein n=1 Tax=Chara braunii TaxID=69332 RepID=A0A388KGL3_CHABU|nr:hypothetical protein CBR_g3879 [Chara braunii]|eukprot:GBG69179.1 hypothetical protein CBR_g3879 [Chara braunii]